VVKEHLYHRLCLTMDLIRPNIDMSTEVTGLEFLRATQSFDLSRG